MMNVFKKFCFINIFFILIFLINYDVVYSETKSDVLILYKWPELITKFLKEPEPNFAIKDPLLTDIICPSITRADVSQKYSSPQILSVIKVDKDNDTKKPVWKLRLKENLYWWNKSQVKIQDLKEFIEQKLSLILKREFFYVTDLPKFNVKLEGQYVVIYWQDDINFGPYIFNNYPLWRQTAKGFECVSFFKPEIEKDIIRLISLDKSNYQILVYQNTPVNKADNKSTKWINFNFAADYESNSKQRAMEDPIKCSFKLDLPIITGIIWNVHKEYIKDYRLRQIFTQILPRGTIVRGIAGHLGDLLSAPILRFHPGYNYTILVRPFNLNKAGDALMQLGFIRHFAKGIRYDPKGQIFELNIYVQKIAINSILTKIIFDSFSTLGIKINFISSDKNTVKFDEVDGILESFYIPWPSADFIYMFHSRAPEFTYPFWNIKDSSFDKMLEDYHLSLSFEHPNFNYLRNIHKYFYDKELISVIMNHKVCVESNLSNIQQLSILDTNWWQKFIGNSNY